MQPRVLQSERKEFAYELAQIMDHPPEESYELLVGDLRYGIEQELFTNWKRIFQNFGVEDLSELVPEMDVQEIARSYVRQIERVFLRLFILEKNDTIAVAKEKAFSVTKQLMSLLEQDPNEIGRRIQGIAEAEGLDLSSVALKTLIKDAKRVRTALIAIPGQQVSRQSLINILYEIKNLLAEEPDSAENYFSRNIQIHKRLRRIVSSPLYWIRKDREGDSLIFLVHRLILSQYAETSQTDHFRRFGRKILQLTPLDKRQSHFPEGGIITNTWFHLKDHRVPIYDREAFDFYSRKKWEELVRQEEEEQRACQEEVAPFTPLDHRVDSDNTPGSLIDHELHFAQAGKIKTIFARFVTMGVPVVGEEPSPEFCAALQAMENFQLDPPNCNEGAVSDHCFFSFWNYANLQNIAHETEGKSSTAMHRLNELCPLSFRSISIAQNTAFMMNRTTQTWNTALQEEMIQALIDDDNFSYVGRERAPGGGYFFPAHESKEWRTVLPRIVELAFRCVDENYIYIQSVRSDFRPRVFKDLVNIGIAQYHQKLSIKKLIERGAEISRFVESSVCRGGIDRGASNTLQRLHPYMEDLDFKTGFLHGRPLLVARRLMHDHHALGVASLVGRLPKDAIADFLDLVGKVSDGGTPSQLTPIRRQPL